MINIVSDKNILNGKIIEKEEVNKQLVADNTRIYEVIRVINKKPVFLKEHFNRLVNSIKLSNISYNISYEEFEKYATSLIDANNFDNCNIRVSFMDGEEQKIMLYFIKSFYPDKAYYENGIHTVTIVKERKNPNIKKNTVTYRDEVDAVLKENNAFEAILVNKDNTISEGSKSNVFFVKGNTVITARDEDVLLGVTRNKVMSVIEQAGYKLEKRIIEKSEFEGFDAAFITGTSNNVLPIRTIDKKAYYSSENEVVKKLMAGYEALLK